MAEQDRAPDNPKAVHEQFIPVRKTDILDALTSHPALANVADRDAFRQVCRLLASIFHYEHFERLERLRDAYFYFNPEIDPRALFDQATLDRNYSDLIKAFEAVLRGANFIEVTRDEIERAHRTQAIVPVEVKAPHEAFRSVRFFRRGHHNERVQVPRWWGLRSATWRSRFMTTW